MPWIATGGFALLALGAKNAVRATWAQVGILLPTLVVMVLLRDQVRQLTLRHAGFEHPSWVEPQWGPLAVFFLLLVGAAPNAIAYASGQFTTKQFFVAGIPASVLLMAVLAFFVWLIWPAMGMPVLM